VIDVRSITQAGEWDALVLGLPNAHLLQAWQWGEFKRRTGWVPDRLAFTRDGRTVAAAAVLARRAGPFVVLYAPKGPVMDYADAALAGDVLAALESHARARRALFLKLDPDVPAGAPGGFAAALAARPGWRPGDDVQFRGTLLLDIARGEDDLLAALKPKTRYNIRLAARKGVSVRAGAAGDLPALYRMYAETSARDGFLIRPYDYYLDAWERFMAAGLAQPLIAQVEGEDVAAVFVYRFGARAYYLYGASRDRHRDKMPNYLLQWEAIRWAQAQGCTLYDFWGAPEELPGEGETSSDPLAGVYRFKQGFNATHARWMQAHDYAAWPAGYWAYTRVMPRVLAWMRRRGGEGVKG
jgi:peptidoglycan pentaglycine glycine transferase (the first glycine)